MKRFDSDIPALYFPGPMAEGEVVVLPEEEARHLRALRLGVGDTILLLDGKGARAQATLELIEKRRIVARLTSITFDGPESTLYIALALGVLADKSRLEWCVEKGVELGVREFIPLNTERSEGFFHRERLERVAIAALKQSQRGFLPQFREPERFPALLTRMAEYDETFICHELAPKEQSLLATLERRESPGDARLLLMIGPEGGFSEGEVEAAVAAGADLVSLGDTRLRAETAAIVALALVGAVSP